jgi:hypothetical protein
MATSRGAGAAQRGYEYKVYKSGGKVKKYAEGGSVEANQMGFSSGGKVAKYAKGGSCRGMGSATKGGKYTIK